MTSDRHDEVVRAMRRMGLIGAAEAPVMVPLAGGVSSDIWRVDCGDRRFCVKRALPRLRVAAEWLAPVTRNASELAWLRLVGDILPGAVPRVLGHDPEAGLFAMEWLPPQRYPVWKSLLLAGQADCATAVAVAERLVRIHNVTASRPDAAASFPNDATFRSIRIEPYLLATARAHPDRALALSGLAEATAGTRLALVHGDVSPKNILIGPAGPVFLDAECAWYGDPAFDLAFCLNHLLLKCLARPQSADDYLVLFAALADAYLAAAAWEPAAALERRTARLLPALFLGRVDGKSPVEYITAEDHKERVRRVARRLLFEPADTLTAVRAAWREELRS